VSSAARLPRTARDVLRLRPWEALAYGGVVALARWSGMWTHPIRACGDLERMRFLDKAYWIYKSTAPIRRARRGSGLEDLFERHRAARCELPDGLRVDSRLRISAVGDLMNHPYLGRSGESLYREVEELIFGADLPMANLECVVSAGPAGSFEISTRAGPPLHLRPEELAVIGGVGGRRYAFMGTACNHSLDLGGAGVDSTIEALRGAGIVFHGTNTTDGDARSAAIVEKGGFRIGVLAFTFGLNGRRPPPGRPLIVNRMDLNGPADALDCSLVEAQLACCRVAAVDFVVAQLHWGLEHELFPSPEQLDVAHRLAELGVDAIIGHHPHVVQPLELYRTRRDPSRIVPVFYSLGSLTTPFSAPFLRRSAVATMQLARGIAADATVRTYVSDARMAGVVQVVDEGSGTLSLTPGAVA